jgi:hypothetical protein
MDDPPAIRLLGASDGISDGMSEAGGGVPVVVVSTRGGVPAVVVVVGPVGARVPVVTGAGVVAPTGAGVKGIPETAAAGG